MCVHAIACPLLPASNLPTCPLLPAALQADLLDLTTTFDPREHMDMGNCMDGRMGGSWTKLMMDLATKASKDTIVEAMAKRHEMLVRWGGPGQGRAGRGDAKQGGAGRGDVD